MLNCQLPFFQLTFFQQLLECIKNEVIPPEIVEDLEFFGITFYDGRCCNWQGTV
jgi:hypothetical protein